MKQTYHDTEHKFCLSLKKQLKKKRFGGGRLIIDLMMATTKEITFA